MLWRVKHKQCDRVGDYRVLRWVEKFFLTTESLEKCMKHLKWLIQMLHESVSLKRNCTPLTAHIRECRFSLARAVARRMYIWKACSWMLDTHTDALFVYTDTISINVPSRRCSSKAMKKRFSWKATAQRRKGISVESVRVQFVRWVGLEKRKRVRTYSLAKRMQIASYRECFHWIVSLANRIVRKYFRRNFRRN